MIDSNSEKSQNIHLLVKYSILKLISHFITQYPLIQMGTNFTGRYNYKCKLYSAGLQDHIDNLKAKVNQLEADKRDRVVTKKIKVYKQK